MINSKTCASCNRGIAPDDEYCWYCEGERQNEQQGGLLTAAVAIVGLCALAILALLWAHQSPAYERPRKESETIIWYQLYDCPSGQAPTSYEKPYDQPSYDGVQTVYKQTHSSVWIPMGEVCQWYAEYGVGKYAD